MASEVSKRFRLAGVALCIVLLCGATVSVAEAQSAAERETARRLMDEGRMKEAATDYAGALKAYQAAHKIMGVSSTGLSVVKSQVVLGQLVEARETAISVVNAPRVDENPVLAMARREAAALANELTGKIPTIKVTVDGARPSDTFTVDLDGERLSRGAALLPLPVNPGTHTVRVVAAENRTADSTVQVREREHKEVRFDLASTTARSQPIGRGPNTPLMTYVGFGAAGTGMLAGAVTGVISMSKTSSAKDKCDGNRCPPETKETIDSANTFASVSNISFGVAIIGAAVGVYGMLSSRDRGEEESFERSSVTVTPVVGIAHAGIVGTF